ncbi:cell adhesion molecule CEACAM5-like isoform X2 [Siphateles boraxobius]|uniref:cell adhesion molecule CEACAM5-like isoform X2 n=1 Tax=Siphateles boraxobius TaxID=180520 RepID=UPI004062D210
MNCKDNLLLLFLCGFAALSVSTETCGKDLLVGTSCIIKLTTRNNVKPPEIRWIHDRTTGYILRWKGVTIRDKSEGVSMEEDGSLRFSSVSLNDTGKYTFTAFNAEGTEIVKGEVEIKVYEKAPKPTVKFRCTDDGKATLSCDIGNRKDLTLSWYKEDKIIQNYKNSQVFLSSTQVQENKPYSCEAHNPVSKHKSESIRVSCKVEKKAVGDEVSFRPDKPLPAGVTSITWKHINNGVTINAIEWEDGETTSPNPRFKDNTTLDTKTGQITITNLTVEHTGVYTIDISGKEQEQRFTLTVMEPVPKPVIKIEKSTDNSDVVYLICEYSETIIWKNSAGETLTGLIHLTKGESITVKNERNPEIFYTCTLQNTVSEETSDPVYERDLFKGLNREFVIWISIVVICLVFILLFLFIPPLYDSCAADCERQKTSRK